MIRVYHAVRNGFMKQPSKTLNDSIGIMLRSYTTAINKQQGRSGSLFRRKTKAICLTQSNTIPQIKVEQPEEQYPSICHQYILNNPVKAGLVRRMEDRDFSSAQDGIKKRPIYQSSGD